MSRIFILLLSVFLLVGCAADDSPEQQIREMIGRAESVFDSRALLDARVLLSDSYQDRDKRTKQTLLRLLGGYFLRNKSIHLLVQTDRIDLEDAARPRVTLYVAMAGKPFADVEQVLALRAGLYRFDLELIDEEGDWRVISSRWQPATREDFLGMDPQ